jgi:putative transposase
MTEPTIALKEYLIKIGLNPDADFLREGVQLLSQMLMEAEVEQHIGASKHECTPERVGEVNLAIHKLSRGSYYPSLLEPRRPAEKALLAVVQEAYLKGISTLRLIGAARDK